MLVLCMYVYARNGDMFFPITMAANFQSFSMEAASSSSLSLSVITWAFHVISDKIHRLTVYLDLDTDILCWIHSEQKKRRSCGHPDFPQDQGELPLSSGAWKLVLSLGRIERHPGNKTAHDFKDYGEKGMFLWPRSSMTLISRGLDFFFSVGRGRPWYFSKHRKNCECCHHHSLFKGHNVIVHIVVLNCQKCNQCLKCHVSGHKNFQKLWKLPKNLKTFRKSENIQKLSKLSKIDKIVENCQKLSKLSIIVKNYQKCQKWSKSVKTSKKIKKFQNRQKR